MLLNLFAAFDVPGPGDENWLLFDPPVQEILLCTTGRSDIEFLAVNMGNDTITVVQDSPSVLWLEAAGITPEQLAPGDTALAEYNVLWDSPWLEDGEYDIAAISLDPRFASNIDATTEEDPPLVHGIAVTSDGYSLRFGFQSFVEPSTRSGRRFARHRPVRLWLV